MFQFDNIKVNGLVKRGGSGWKGIKRQGCSDKKWEFKNIYRYFGNFQEN